MRARFIPEARILMGSMKRERRIDVGPSIVMTVAAACRSVRLVRFRNRWSFNASGNGMRQTMTLVFLGIYILWLSATAISQG